MRVSLLMLVAIACRGTAAAQAVPEPVVIRTTTRLVTVNVVVRDKNGPVANLDKDDFVLFDHGKQQPISVFTVDTSRTTLSGQAQAQEPNVFTNLLERRANTASNITIILLDGLNTRITDQQYALKQMRLFLARLRPTDRVAIYTLGRTLSVLHDFTADSEQLGRALAGYAGRNDSNAEATVPQEAPKTENARQTAKLKQMLDNAAKNLMPFYYSDSARRTSAALEVIAHHVAPLPGRKNLVWISSSFPMVIGLGESGSVRQQSAGRSSSEPTLVASPGERRVFRKEMEGAARALNNASIAIYPVDAQGITGLTAEYKAESGTTGVQATVDRKPLTGRPAGQETMRDLAARTGGKAFLNTNDIASAVREAIDDAAVTYTLGFYPETDALDGAYHDLRVEVVHHSGLSVRCRQGYYADSRDAVPIDRIKEEVDRALWSPLEAKGITVFARLQREAGVVRVAATIAAEHLSLQEEEKAHWKGVLDVITAQRDAKGRILRPQTQSAAVDINQESYAYYREHGIPYSTTVPLIDGAQELRLVVVDRFTGAVGSVIIPVAEIH